MSSLKVFVLVFLARTWAAQVWCYLVAGIDYGNRTHDPVEVREEQLHRCNKTSPAEMRGFFVCAIRSGLLS